MVKRLPLLALLAATAAAAREPPPPPTRWVTDEVGFLSPASRDALDARLESYERATGHQVVVWIGDTLGGTPLDDFAVRTFAAWRVGRKGHDDGLALFILATDRKFDIEVGYGLEDRVPDATAKRILEDTLAPALRAGQHDQGVTAAVDAILAAIEGHPVPAPGARAPAPAPAPTFAQRLPFLVLGLIVLILVITHPRLALLFLYSMLSGRGGGGGDGGGGFSGGGGSSGGGGARGSW